MSIFSMTGYATSTTESEIGTITLEIKSVNSRFLDLQFRINDEFRSIEPMLRDAISKKIQRGKIECRFSFGKKDNDAKNKELNQVVLSQINSIQQFIASQFPLAQPLTTAEILRWPGVMEESEINTSDIQEKINHAINTTLSDFLISREREGDALSKVLLQCVENMEKIVVRITPLLPIILQQFQQKSIDRLEED